MKKIFKVKRFGWLFGNNLDICDFIDLVVNCNYPNKDKNLKEEILYWDNNFILIDKLNSQEIKNLKKVLGNLKNEVTPILDKNKLGSVDNWRLYVVYLEKSKIGGRYSLGFGMECIKPFSNFSKGNCFSFSIKI